MRAPDSGKWNGILASLSSADYEMLEPCLHPVELKARQRLHSTHRPIDEVYFPSSGLVSLVAVSDYSRCQVEVAMLGREGMTGSAIVDGTDRSPHDVFAQVPGEALRIASGDLRRSMERSRTLLNSLLRFLHVMTVQCEATALAAAQGRLEERAARWLLMAQDRLQSTELPITHELVAWMLGARRAGVTLSLHALQDKGFIRIRRKKLDVIDRDGMIALTHGLYGAPEREYARVIGNFPERATGTRYETSHGHVPLQ